MTLPSGRPLPGLSLRPRQQRHPVCQFRAPPSLSRRRPPSQHRHPPSAQCSRAGGSALEWLRRRVRGATLALLGLSAPAAQAVAPAPAARLPLQPPVPHLVLVPQQVNSIPSVRRLFLLTGSVYFPLAQVLMHNCSIHILSARSSCTSSRSGVLNDSSSLT